MRARSDSFTPRAEHVAGLSHTAYAVLDRRRDQETPGADRLRCYASRTPAVRHAPPNVIEIACPFRLLLNIIRTGILYTFICEDAKFITTMISRAELLPFDVHLYLDGGHVRVTPAVHHEEGITAKGLQARRKDHVRGLARVLPAHAMPQRTLTAVLQSRSPKRTAPNVHHHASKNKF